MSLPAGGDQESPGLPPLPRAGETTACPTVINSFTVAPRSDSAPIEEVLDAFTRIEVAENFYVVGDGPLRTMTWLIPANRISMILWDPSAAVL